MANKEHLEILKQGVEAWNKWREENPDVIPDLSDEDFRGKQYAKINFSKADLSNSKLQRINLKGANLGGAGLRNVSARLGS